MSRLSEYFLQSAVNIVLFETIEVTHPDFSQDYLIVRNNCNGLTATDENDVEKDFIYYPVSIGRGETRENLEQTITLTIGDLGELLPNELRAVRAADGFSTKPIMTYRTWQSDDLSEPLHVIRLNVHDIKRNKKGATLICKAPSLNVNGIGRRYDFVRFFGLRGFL